jgi:hypothetical protein
MLFWDSGYSDEDMRRLDLREPCEAHCFLMTASFRTKMAR